MLTLRELYDDNNGYVSFCSLWFLSGAYGGSCRVRRHETELLDVPDGAGSGDELSEFYTRLNKIKDFHRKYPDTASDPFAVELNGILAQEKTEDDQEDRWYRSLHVIRVEINHALLAAISLLFSGEESYGRYLDLYANHAQYNNLKHIDKRVPYLQYLDILIASKEGAIHRDLPKAARNHKDYERSFSPTQPSTRVSH
jgi:splicing factor 3A subunit 3